MESSEPNLKSYLVLEANTQIEIIEKYFQSTPNGTVLVLENQKVVGTITNGDFRRFILNSNSNQKFINEIANRNFLFVKTGSFSAQDIDLLFKATFVRHIPVLHNDLTLDTVITRNTMHSEIEQMNAIIMAGGKGARLMPLTKGLPKPMLNINETPILEILLKQLIAYRFQKFYFSVNYEKDIIKNYFKNGDNFEVEIRYLEENDYEGTAASLRLLDKNMSENILVMNGDVLTKLNFDQLTNYHLTNENDITVVLNEKHTNIQYGVVQLDGANITRITEKPKLKHYISSGIYIIKTSLLKYIPEKGFFDMPDLINVAIHNNLKVQGYPLTEFWLDIGHIENLRDAKKSWK